MSEKTIIAIGPNYEGFSTPDLDQDYNVVVLPNEFHLQHALEAHEIESPLLFLITCSFGSADLIQSMQELAPVVMSSCGEPHEELKPTYTIRHSYVPKIRFIDQFMQVIKQIEETSTAK